MIKHQAEALESSQHSADAVARWATEHREGIIAAVRAGLQAGEHGPAAALAMAAWQVADRVADPLWCHELARYGEDAAIQGRDPAMLIALLSRSAVLFGEAQVWDEAEAYVNTARPGDPLRSNTRTARAARTS